MPKLTIKPGMNFKPSDKTISQLPYFKDYSYTVVKKQGSKFLVRFYDGIMYGQDLFCKYELENMVLVS